MLLFIYFKYRALKNTVRNLSEAASQKRPFLLNESRFIFLQRLTNEYNGLLEISNQFKNKELEIDSARSQLEAALMNLCESVFLINKDRTICFVNEVSQDWMSGGAHSIVGKSIEDVFRSSELIEFVYALMDGELGLKGQKIVRMQKNETDVFWFEVTGASILEEDSSGSMYILVLHDITQLKRLEGIRQDFVANVSHELRTPVTVIKGFTETLSEDADKLTDALRNKFIEKTHRNVQRLNLLIEDLLILSRLESGCHKEEKQVLDLNLICEEVAENYNLLNKKYIQPIEFLPIEKAAWVLFNKNQCFQILENIVDNAYRYAGVFSKVSIQLDEFMDSSGEYWRCQISDDGIGIPKKYLSRVFERFYRVDPSRSSNSGGTGIGLAIVKHMIQLMGGNVYIESEEGVGTSVIVLFLKNKS